MDSQSRFGKMWRDASLQTKFLILTVPLMLMSTVIFFTIFNINANNSARQALENRMDKVAEIQASSISGPVWFVNFRQLDLILNAMSNDPDFLGVVVLDEDGQTIREVGVMDTTEEAFKVIERDVEYREFENDTPKNIGRMKLAYSEQRLDVESRERLLFVSIMAILLALTTVMGALAAMRYTINIPLNKLLNSIRTAQDTNTHEPIEVYSGDEIGTVVSAYNELQRTQKEYESELQEARDGLEQRVKERTKDLMDREQDLVRARDRAQDALTSLQGAQARLVQSEKMASLGQLTAGIAHEIKNPLNFVNNFARISIDLLDELLETLSGSIAKLKKDEREDAEDLVETLTGNLAKINEHGQRADSIVKNMLAHSREGPSTPSHVDMNALCEEALGLVYHGARAEKPGFNIVMNKELANDLPSCECHAQDILRVLINIMGNGMYAANGRHGDGSDGEQPSITVATKAEGKNVRINITDNGSGIKAADRDKIFTPFFTTKPAGEGTGLGLSLSFDIVETQHGGQLLVESEPNVSTTFTIILPQKMPESLGGIGESE